MAPPVLAATAAPARRSPSGSYPRAEESQAPGSFRDIRVLVVDDNLAIHDDFQRILAAPDAGRTELDALSGALFGDDRSTGPRPIRYHIAHASQGIAAIDLTRIAMAQDRPFAVGFVDMRMPPGWNGVETTKQLRLLDPHLQVVLCTAYSDFRWDEVIAALGSSENLHLLRKPFGPSDVRRMAEVLGTKAARLRR